MKPRAGEAFIGTVKLDAYLCRVGCWSDNHCVSATERALADIGSVEFEGGRLARDRRRIWVSRVSRISRICWTYRLYRLNVVTCGFRSVSHRVSRHRKGETVAELHHLLSVAIVLRHIRADVVLEEHRRER